MTSPWHLKTMGTCQRRGESCKAQQACDVPYHIKMYKDINKNTYKGFPLAAWYSLYILSRAEGQRWKSFCSPTPYPFLLSTFAFQDAVGEDRQKSNLLSRGDRQEDREIKGRRRKTKELNETLLLPGLPEGGQAVGRKHGDRDSESQREWLGMSDDSAELK